MNFTISSMIAGLMSLAFSIIAVAEEIKIPVLVGQTGASATFGKNETDAYALAAEDWNARGGVNGRRVVLQFQDTQTSAKQIVTAFQFLATQKPAIIMGPTWLDGFPAIIPMAKEREILLVTPSAAIEAFSDIDRSWPVTFYHNSTIEIQQLIKGLKERSYKEIALIYEQEPFAEMIRKLVLDTKVSLVADIGVQAGEVDFQAHLAKLKATAPDAIVVFVWDERSLLTLLQQLRVHLPNTQIATVHDGAGWLNNPAFKQVLPRLIYSDFVIDDTSFADRFKERFGYDPILTASNAYDSLNAVLSAMAAGIEGGGNIRNYLMTKEFDTVTFGRFKFAADGSVPSQVAIIDFPSKNL